MLTQPILIAIGQLKDSPEKALFDQYVVRLAKPLHVIQIKQLNDPEKEGNAIMQHITPHDWVCALDERGKNMSSIEFSTHLQESLSTTKRHIFIIGGADGLSQEVRHKAQLLLSFGKLTWPHMMVRAMLCEQIYRAQQIYNHHPYHRA